MGRADVSQLEQLLLPASLAKSAKNKLQRDERRKKRRQIITQTQRAQRDRRAEGQEAEREKEEEGERKEDNSPKPDCPQSLLTCRRSRSTVSARLGSSWVFLGLRGSCRRVSA